MGTGSGLIASGSRTFSRPLSMMSPRSIAVVSWQRGTYPQHWWFDPADRGLGSSLVGKVKSGL